MTLITTMTIKFSRKPARAISGRFTCPLPNTIALGGVATGNMNAQLAASAAGTANIKGFSPTLIASAATTGRNAAVVAVLLVNSVRKIIIVLTKQIC